MARIEEKMLGQVSPATTDAVTAYTFNAAKLSAIAKGIMVCNTSDAKALFSIFYDQAGSTYNRTTAVHFEQEIPPKSTLTKDVFTALNAGTIGVQTDKKDAVTFTFFGAELEDPDV